MNVQTLKINGFKYRKTKDGNKFIIESGGIVADRIDCAV
jgi:hypothetical protein